MGVARTRIQSGRRKESTEKGESVSNPRVLRTVVL